MGKASKTAIILLTLLCFAFSSCKKKAEQKLLDHTALSQKVEDLQKNASWAYEIEGERLSKKINTMDSIAKNISLTPSALIALEGGGAFSAIYPELADFGSLDTTNIQGEVFDLVNNFCAALCEYTSITEAETDTEAKTPSPTQKDSSKIDAFFESQTLYSLVLFLSDTEDAGAFNSYIIGQPFIDEDSIEVPVRFTCQNKMLYAYVYTAMQGDLRKIQQIEIYKEGV